MNFPNLSRSKLLGGVLILVALCAGAFLLFGGLGNGNQPNVPVTGANDASGQNQGRLGRMFVARSVDNNGCPAQETTSFRPEDSILVGFEESQIPQGTTVFARLNHNGQALEDSQEITADQDINSCVWFEFAPSGGSDGFDPGSYSAELMVNGSRAGRANLEVVGSSGSLFPGIQDNGAGSGDLQLGQGYTASQIDQNGCPASQANSFYSDEAIYIAYEDSFIPQGTEVFARLNYEGQPVEDTDPIIANSDLRSCFWFVFEPDRYGFDSGSYSIDLFVNGGRYESLPLEVQ